MDLRHETIKSCEQKWCNFRDVDLDEVFFYRYDIKNTKMIRQRVID